MGRCYAQTRAYAPPGAPQPEPRVVPSSTGRATITARSPTYPKKGRWFVSRFAQTVRIRTYEASYLLSLASGDTVTHENASPVS